MKFWRTGKNLTIYKFENNFVIQSNIIICGMLKLVDKMSNLFSDLYLTEFLNTLANSFLL